MNLNEKLQIKYGSFKEELHEQQMGGRHVGAGWSPCCDNFFEVWKR